MGTNKLEDESRLIIQNQHFSNESSLAKYIEWDALARISFVNCDFEKVHLLGKVIGSCSFQNCTFNDFNARKAKFSSCHFEDCQITNSDMTRAEFYDSSFTNCNFLAVDLAASDFGSCKLKRTTFFKSNLDLILVEDVKVWKSNEWIEIKDESNFEKILKDMNLISTDEDEMENS
ncbi:MAG: hypothetical protein ACI9OT_002254 [Gammaproteobacteria bacterium]|jgi:uncharacterized protein YjbI with pentapeptide repeats